MLIEVLLKFLIGIVDVELFKPIHLEAEMHINIPRLVCRDFQENVKCLTSKFSKPKMSRMPMDLKFSLPLIF